MQQFSTLSAISRLFSFCIFFIAFSLSANTQTVSCPNATRLYVDASNPNSPATDGLSWATAFSSLDKALNLANSCSNITEIWVKNGNYIPSAYPAGATNGATPRDYAFALKNGLAIYGGFRGNETLLQQRNIAANPTFLLGNRGVSGNKGDNCYHVVVSVNNDSTAVLDGFTVRSGNADNAGHLIGVNSYSLHANQGGGIILVSSAPAIRNCTISNNIAGEGGGIMVTQAVQAVSISNNRFINNTAANGGGAISIEAAAPVAVSNNYFEHNKGGLGGAIRANGLFNITAAGNIFNANASLTGNGGALSFNLGSNNSTIVNNLFIANTDVSATNGGGAVNFNDGNNLVVNNTFFADTAGERGGAIRMQGNGSLNVYNNLFTRCKSKIDNDLSVATTGGISYSKGANLFSTDAVLFSNPKRFFGPDSIWATADDGLHLPPGGKGLNEGDNSKLPAFITTDITGTSRVQDGKVDIGAYEGAGPAMLAAFIIADTTVCKYTISPVRYIAHNGVSPYTFTFNINNRFDNQTITTYIGDSSVLDRAILRSAGTFIYRLISVTDATGNTVLVSGQTTLTVRQVPTITITPSGGPDSICYGGTMQVGVTGAGTAKPYTYKVDGGAFSSKSNFSVSAGKHVFYVQDSKGCMMADSITLRQPAQTLQAVPVQLSSTSMQVNATGGFGPAYTYSLNNGAFHPSNILTLPRPTGVDTVKVRDRKGCQASSVITLLSVALNHVNDSVCFGAKSTITAVARGGAAPLKYRLNGGSYQTEASFLVPAGNYTITVVDANNVSAVTPKITIRQPAAQLASSAVINSSGVTVTSTGGFGGYRYNFDGGALQSSGHFNWGGVTNDTIITHDTIGCTAPVYLKGLFATLDAEDHLTIACVGEKKNIIAQASGGIPPYGYSLNGGAFHAKDTFNVLPGRYAVRVKDAKNNVFKTDSINITLPSQPLTLTTISHDVTCQGASDGSITASAAGGAGNFMYNINGGTYTPVSSFSNLSKGNYKIAVKDAAGCRATKVVVIIEQATSCLAATPVPAPPASVKANIAGGLKVKVYPNPAPLQFNLRVTSGDSRQVVEIRVIDVLGRTIYQTRGSVYETYTFGRTFAAGMYVTEVLNGSNVQRVKLVKGN